MARRILIKGGSGAGKSTLGLCLAQHLGVPFLELDSVHHGANWASASAAEMQARVRSALDDERGWVVDGNYENKLGTLILERAELILWLDLPLGLKLRRLSRRTAGRYVRQQVLWNGNRETVKDAFWGSDALFPWAVRSHFSHRRNWPRTLAPYPVIRLRSAQAVSAWLDIFRDAQPGSP